MAIKLFLSLTFICILCLQNAHAISIDDFNRLPQGKKVIYLNTALVGGIMLWGLAFWDYGKSKPSAHSEHWFDENSPNGGADKFGHFYSSYVLSHGFAYLYESWGYETHQATKLGAISSFTLQGLMELGDAYSRFGFAYDDLILNALGSYAGYLHYRYPEFSKKLDFRVEYFPSRRFFREGSLDFFTDYDGMKFLVAAKLDGFSFIQNEYLKYLEIHLGYFSRGYGDTTDTYTSKSRNIYVGIGLNVSRIFRKLSLKKTSKVLTFVQLPYTYIAIDNNLNN